MSERTTPESRQFCVGEIREFSCISPSQKKKDAPQNAEKQHLKQRKWHIMLVAHKSFS